MPATLFEQEVLPLFELTREEWLAEARAAARQLAERNTEITIDDVRAICPPPDSFDGRVMGAVFAGKAWECRGYKRSERKTCHGRPIGIFALKRGHENGYS